MTHRRYFSLFIALLLIVLSWWGIVTARTGLVMRSLERGGVPLLYVAPENAKKVPGVLVAHGFAGSKQLMLGHSMGSGAVMSAGIGDVNRFAATVAISPTGAQVTPSAPRNLQLQAGSWEGGFVRNAQRMLAAAGGENDNLAEGKGRSLLIIPNAEHITILFRNASHQAALKWLNATFGISSTSRYVDHWMIWYGLHLVGWLISCTWKVECIFRN